MSLALAADAFLALLILGLAIWTIAASATYGAVVGFVAYGLLVALVWVRLGSVDVAMTEAALGSGLTGLLLLGAAAHLAPLEAAERRARPGPWLRLLVGALCVAVTAGLAAVVLSLPEPAPTLAPAVAEHLATTRGQEPGHRGPARLSRHRHPAGVRGPGAGPDRGLVPGDGPGLGRAPGVPRTQGPGQRPDPAGPGPAPLRHPGGDPSPVDRGRRPRRQVPGRGRPGRHVGPGPGGRAAGGPRPWPAARCAGSSSWGPWSSSPSGSRGSGSRGPSWPTRRAWPSP